MTPPHGKSTPRSLKKPDPAINSKIRRNAKKETTKLTPSKRKDGKDDDKDHTASELNTDELDDGSAEDWDSDALDEDKNEFPSSKKRKKSASSPKKRRKRQPQLETEISDDELPEGQILVGRVVQAPTGGRVPPGQISQNTLDFLKQLAKPECNDREWFRLHEPVYRQAEREWKDWIEAFTTVLTEIDDHIPELPPKDVIHRIYRDIRFSNDKTPYKQGFSASFSRSGRKGIFAHYHVAVIPNGRSLIAAGAWQPGKNELSTIRHHIQHDPSRLRNIISDPEFVEYFGKPSPHPKGERQNVFGHDDELKVAPKGIDKNHKDIDLLKLRSIAVVHHFLDSEVVSPDFKENVGKVVKLLKPLVHCLNDMMTLPVDED